MFILFVSAMLGRQYEVTNILEKKLKPRNFINELGDRAVIDVWCHSDVIESHTEGDSYDESGVQ